MWEERVLYKMWGEWKEKENRNMVSVLYQMWGDRVIKIVRGEWKVWGRMMTDEVAAKSYEYR